MQDAASSRKPFDSRFAWRLRRKAMSSVESRAPCRSSSTTPSRLPILIPRRAFNDRAHATTHAASRKIPVEPVTERASRRPRKLDPRPGGGATSALLPSFSTAETAPRLLHLGSCARTLGSNNSWPRGTR